MQSPPSRLQSDSVYRLPLFWPIPSPVTFRISVSQIPGQFRAQPVDNAECHTNVPKFSFRTHIPKRATCTGVSLKTSCQPLHVVD